MKELAAPTIEDRRRTRENVDFTGPGIAEGLMNAWAPKMKRFGARFDFEAYPRDPDLVKLLRGESEYDYRDAKLNEVNNPFHLIRPYSVMSCDGLYSTLGSDFYRDAPSIYGHDPKDRGAFYTNRTAETEKMRFYLKVAEGFEICAAAALKSLDIEDKQKRLQAVQKVLEEVARRIQESSRYIKSENTKQYIVPQLWLTYIVVSLLNRPEDEVMPAGRLRALELLELYPPEDLYRAFRGLEKEKYYNGYDRSFIPRIPYTFCSREERLQKDHKDLWQLNPKIASIIVRDANHRVDLRATTSNVVEKYPHEAIQIALLLLHDHSLSDWAIQFLRAVPRLDQKTRSQMFGKHATFLAEIRHAQGSDMDVAEGLGIAEIPQEDELEEFEGLGIEDLQQLVRRKETRIQHLEEELGRANSIGSRFGWDKLQLEARIRQLEAEVRYWQNGGRGPAPRTSSVEDVYDVIDPKGYFRALGLHPDSFEGLTEEEINEMVKRQYRFLAKKFHPDKQGDEEKFKALNNANEVLSDPEKRKKYMGRSRKK